MYSCNSPSAPRCLPVSMLYRGACLCLYYIEVPACVYIISRCLPVSVFACVRVVMSVCVLAPLTFPTSVPSLFVLHHLCLGIFGTRTLSTLPTLSLPPPFPWASTLPSPFLFPSASPPVPASLSLPEPCRQDNLGCNLDVRSLHGGCDVIRGDKWAANYWIANKL